MMRLPSLVFVDIRLRQAAHGEDLCDNSLFRAVQIGQLIQHMVDVRVKLFSAFQCGVYVPTCNPQIRANPHRKPLSSQSTGFAKLVSFANSKVMNWVALDRGLRLADKRALPADRATWMRERDRIYDEVMTRGWNEKRHAFTQYYGSDDLDASLLIMPLVFFMAPTDPRMLSTIRAILESPRNGGLVSDSLVYRYPPQCRIDGRRARKALSTCALFGLWRR